MIMCDTVYISGLMIIIVSNFAFMNIYMMMNFSSIHDECCYDNDWYHYLLVQLG